VRRIFSSVRRSVTTKMHECFRIWLMIWSKRNNPTPNLTPGGNRDCLKLEIATWTKAGYTAN
jgi:hypothetical protein